MTEPGFHNAMSKERDDDAKTGANSGLVLGGERFKDQIEAVLARSIRAGRPGRPRKRRIEADTSDDY